MMSKCTSKKRKPIDEDVIYAGTGYEEPEENEKRRSRRIDKANPKSKRKKTSVMPKREKEDIVGGELICPHPECNNKIYISQSGCNITMCTSTSHGQEGFYFCCHCKVECRNYIAYCDCSDTIDIGTRKKEQKNRNKRAAKCPVDLTLDDEDDMMTSRKPTEGPENELQDAAMPGEIGTENDASTTTSGRSSSSSTSSSPFSLPSSSTPTDGETDEDTLKPQAKSGMEWQIHARNENETGAGHKSSRDLSYMYEFDTVRGGAIAPSHSSLHVFPFPTPPSSLPSSSQPTDDETKDDILIAGKHPGTTTCTAESEGEDDVIRVAAKITHSATEYQVHPDDAVSMNAGTLRLQEGTPEVSPSYEAYGNDSGPIADDQSPKLREGHDDGDFGGIGIVEDATERINQDIGDDDYFPPPPPLPGQVVETGNASIAHTGNKTNDERWNKRLVELRDYKKQKGHCNVPRSQGQLGTWVNDQRKLHRKREKGEQTPLTDERVAALEAIGFQWDGIVATNEELWNERFVELQEYKKKKGHCNVPQRHGPLGTWVGTQRYLYQKREKGEETPLTDDRVAALEKIGFQWRLR